MQFAEYPGNIRVASLQWGVNNTIIFKDVIMLVDCKLLYGELKTLFLVGCSYYQEVQKHDHTMKELGL